jgi:long-subunit acyl-CoA synthetase (AMP-forming)
MGGYYGNDAATAETITPDGSVRPGDLAACARRGRAQP